MLDSPSSSERIGTDGIASAGREGTGTRLSEGVLGTLVQLAGWGADFPRAVTPHLARLGIIGPGNFRDVQSAGPAQSFRIAPDRILLRHADESALWSALADIDKTRLVALDLSHARDALILEGGSVEHVLAQLAAVDFTLPQFSVGQFAQTGLDQVSCLVQRLSTNAFELMVPCSFSRHMRDAIIGCLDSRSAAS